MDINSNNSNTIREQLLQNSPVNSGWRSSFKKAGGYTPVNPGEVGIGKDKKISKFRNFDTVRTEPGKTGFFAKIKDLFLKSSILSKISSFFMIPFRALKSLFCRQPSSPETDYKNFLSELKKTNPNISIEDAFVKINETNSETEQVNRLALFILDENNFDDLRNLADKYLRDDLGIVVDDEANRSGYQREALALLLIGKDSYEAAGYNFNHIKNFLSCQKTPYFPNLEKAGIEGIIIALNEWSPASKSEIEIIKSETPTQPKTEPKVEVAGESEIEKPIQKKNENYEYPFRTIKDNSEFNNRLLSAAADKGDRFELLAGIFSDPKQLAIASLTSQILSSLDISMDNDEVNSPAYQQEALLLLLIGKKGMKLIDQNFKVIPEDKVRNFTPDPYFKELESAEAENIFRLIKDKIKENKDKNSVTTGKDPLATEQKISSESTENKL